MREAMNLRLTRVDLEMLLQRIVFRIRALHLWKECVIRPGTGRKFHIPIPELNRIDCPPFVPHALYGTAWPLSIMILAKSRTGSVRMIRPSIRPPYLSHPRLITDTSEPTGRIFCA